MCHRVSDFNINKDGSDQLDIIPEEPSNIFGVSANKQSREDLVDIPEAELHNIDAQMDGESHSSSSSKKSNPTSELKFIPTVQRRRSFEIPQSSLLTFPLPQSLEGEEMQILEDPNTYEPKTTLNRPRWSGANDDTEFLRRKKEAK